MKKNKKPTLRRAFAVLLSITLAFGAALPAFAGTRNEHVELQLGENALTLGTELSDSYYYFTPETSGDYVIRSVSTAPADPYMEYNFTSYLNHGESKDFYCVVSLTAGQSAEFLIRDIVDDSSVTVIVEEKEADLPNPLSLGDNALILNKKNYAEECSFTPAESGVYRFTSSGYGQPGCVWGDEDISGGMLVGEEWSWQFSFEKELTGGTGYVFKPYNQSGAYEGVVTITKLDAATVELDALELSFGTAPAVLNTIGSASVALPADPHCTVEWTWEDQYGNELADDELFRCGSWFLSATVTPDSGYAFADNAAVTFAALDAAADHEIVVSANTAIINARFFFGGENGHTYAGWEELSNAQVTEAGLGDPYAGCVWKQNVCTVCGHTKYRGGDSAEICVIDLTLSNAPAADLTADDVTVAVPDGRPYYLVAPTAGANPDYPGWIGDFGDGMRFLCCADYTGFCVLFPAEGHFFSRDGDLEININVTPADAVTDTDYVFLSDSEGVYVSADFAQTDHIYTGPVWSWKEDYTEAYAAFACAYGDWTVTATVHNPVMSEVSPATYTQDQVIKHTAHTEFRGEQYEQDSGNVTVAGTAAALLAADTATFNSYKAEKAAALDDLAQNGDSAASSALIADAKATITNLAFDTEKSLEDNKTAVDTAAVSVTEQLAADLQAQRAAEALAADKAAFEEYKAAKAAELDTLAEEGDSAASQALISAAKAEIAALAYDESKTLEENKGAADTGAAAIAAQLSADLQTQRAADQAAQEEKPDEPQENPQQQESGFRRFLNRIRDFFHRIAEFFRNLFKR